MIQNKPARSQVYEAMSRERGYQDDKRGPMHDRGLSIQDFIDITRQELDEAQEALDRGKPNKALAELLQTGTVTVAAIENNRLVERWDLEAEQSVII